MQPTNLLYDKLARYYDAVYAKKNFRAEAQWIHRYLTHHKPTTKGTLLDVACGTGRHIAYWQKFYQCTGVDISKGAINIAKKHVSRATFAVADMNTLKLSKKFEVVACLFGSIAYARTLPNLRQLLRTLSAHTKTSGFLIVEPWLSSKKFVSGFASSNRFRTKRGALYRLSYSLKWAREAEVHEYYYIILNGNVHYYQDTHYLGLFDSSIICNELERLGFHILHRKNLKIFPNGVIIAKKTS